MQFTSAPPNSEGTETGVPRDRYGRYLIPRYTEPVAVTEPVKGEGMGQPWTRATTFAKSMADTYGLTQWQLRMAVKGLASRPDLIALAAATRVDDKETLGSIAEQAKDAAATRAAANMGTAMHAFTELLDGGRTLEEAKATLPEAIYNDLAAYAEELERHGIQQIPGMMEKRVVVPEYGVAGTFDRIVMWNGRPTVADLKTGRDLKYGWNEIAIQLALYANSAAIWDGEFFQPLPAGLRTDKALVFHLPIGQAVCTVYEVDLAQGWAACALIQQVRAWRTTKGVARAIDANSKAITAQAVATPVEDAVAITATSAPVALEPGKKACSVCRQPGHRKGSAKCPGTAVPLSLATATLVQEAISSVALDGETVDVGPVTVGEANTDSWCRCTSRSAGWTAPPEGGDGQWVCGDCKKPSRAGQITGTGEPIEVTVNKPFAERVPVTPQVEADPEPVVETPAERTWEQKIQAATTKAEIRDIRTAARDLGQWSDDLTAVGVNRLKELVAAG